MTVTAGTTAHLSVDFSGAELAVLAADLGHGPLLTRAMLPADLTRRGREQALQEAALSLRSRRVITDSDAGRQIASPVAALLDIVCAPLARVDLYAPQRIRFLIQAEATVRMQEHDGRQRLTPFATADLVAWIAADAGLTGQPAAPGTATDLSAPSYVDLRRALRSGRAPDARLVAGLALSLMSALAAGDDRALSVRRRDQRGRVVGGELAWVEAVGAGLWSVPTIDTPLAGDHARGVEPIGPDPSTTVRIEPFSAQRIAEAIVAFLQDAP
jgi:hypothetical protein